MTATKAGRTLLSLDDDVLRYFIEAVWPKEFEAFVSTCKRIYALSACRREEHNALKKKYKTTVVSGTRYTPSHVLRDIGENHLVAHYVDELIFTTSSYPHFYMDHEKRNFGARAMRGVKGLLASLPVVGAEDELLERFQRPEPLFSDTSLATLLLLPNLRYLRLRSRPFVEEALVKLFSSALSLPAHQRPFQHLRIVEDFHLDRLFPDATVWALAEGVRTLLGHTGSSTNPNHPSNVMPRLPTGVNWPLHSSQMERLELTGGVAISGELPKLLHTMTNLREFKICGSTLSPHFPLRLYSGDGEPVVDTWDVKCLVETLASTCPHTLSVLHLAGVPWRYTTLITSMQGLHKLVEFEGDIIMFLPEDFDTGGEIPSFTSIFPPSLERLILSIGDLAEPTNVFLRDISPDTDFRTSLPKLSRFSYHSHSLRKQTYANLKACGITVGRKWGEPTDLSWYIPNFAKHWDLARGREESFDLE